MQKIVKADGKKTVKYSSSLTFFAESLFLLKVSQAFSELIEIASIIFWRHW